MSDQHLEDHHSQDAVCSELARLVGAAGHDPACVTAVETLRGGISGAATYRVIVAPVGAIVCKLTRAGCAHYVWERALREWRFYRHLRPHQPLRTPRMLASTCDERGLALALTAYHSPIPASQWTRRGFLAVADHLAHLHAAHWNDTESLATHAWLRRRGFTSSPRERERATVAWRTLASEAHIPLERIEPALRLLDRLDDLERTIAAYPVTLLHGDCHADNLLRDGAGRLIWADWQEVGVGPGPADLVFFLERALYDGAEIHAEAMLARYYGALETRLGHPLDLIAVRQAAAALEVRDWLLAWPSFLRTASPCQLTMVLARIAALATECGRPL